jgi:purine-nucleoside phosphorylase
MPTTSAGARGSDPFEQAHVAARELARRTHTERHDVLVVLGTGLTGVAEEFGADGPGVDLASLPWFPRFTALGHRAEAWSLSVGGHRVLVTAGRTHLYEGRSAIEVAHTVRMAIAAGVHTVVLTCSSGAIHGGFAVGDVVLVADHLNLTGTSPLIGIAADHPAGTPFVDLTECWSTELRDRARTVRPTLREGVYAQLGGPHLETPAEVRMLATLGADLVGMSMVLEAIAARHLGADLLGLAVVANAAAGTGAGVLSAADIHTTSAAAAPDVTTIVRGVLEDLPATS